MFANFSGEHDSDEPLNLGYHYFQANLSIYCSRFAGSSLTFASLEVIHCNSWLWRAWHLAAEFHVFFLFIFGFPPNKSKDEIGWFNLIGWIGFPRFLFFRRKPLVVDPWNCLNSRQALGLTLSCEFWLCRESLRHVGSPPNSSTEHFLKWRFPVS